MKNIRGCVISCGTVIIIGIILFFLFSQDRYQDIYESIRDGEGYGFRIGEDQTAVFEQLKDMAAHDHVCLFTVHSGDNFFSLDAVAEEFSDWSVWLLRAPKPIVGENPQERRKIDIFLEFRGNTLAFLNEFHGYMEGITPLSAWPEKKDISLYIEPGMSAEEVYETLRKLSMLEEYQGIEVRPEIYRNVTTFTPEELTRVKRQTTWHIDLNPQPGYEERNYLFFRFDHGKLIEIIRRKDASDLLDDILNLFSKRPAVQKLKR